MEYIYMGIYRSVNSNSAFIVSILRHSNVLLQRLTQFINIFASVNRLQARCETPETKGDACHVREQQQHPRTPQPTHPLRCCWAE